MANLALTDKLVIISCELSLLVRERTGEERIVRLPSPQQTESPGQAEGKAVLAVSCLSVSPCGRFLAVCDDRKQVCVLSLPDFSLLNQQNLLRKASCVTFSRGSDCVLLGDKSGDVYSVQVKGGAPSLLLGHLSQLLDLAISHAGDLVLTADRDEKIRVSRFPNAYNILNFCLGHTEFVTCLCLVGEDQILSGSGDGTVRLWNYRDGVELYCQDVTQQVRQDEENKGKQQEKVETQTEKNGVTRVDPPSEPAVVKIRTLGDQIIVQVENCQNLFIYNLTGSSSSTIKFNSYLELNSFLLDFDTSGGELTVLRKTETSAVLDFYLLEQGNIIKDNSVALEGQDKFFQSIENFEDDGVKNLHKRWFDNMKEYLERKEARLEKAKSKSSSASLPVPIKKQKCET